MRKAIVTVISEGDIVYHRECIVLANTIYLDDNRRDKLVFYDDQLFIEKDTDETHISIALGKEMRMTLTIDTKEVILPITLHELSIQGDHIKAIYDTGEKIEINIDLIGSYL